MKKVKTKKAKSKKVQIADFHVVNAAIKEYFHFLDYTIKINGEFYLSDAVSRFLKTNTWEWNIDISSIEWMMTNVVKHVNRSISVEEAYDEFKDFYITIKADNNSASFGIAPSYCDE